MPRKSSQKNPSSRPIDDSMKQDIASAANDIPGLIYQSMKEERETARHSTPHQKNQPSELPPEKKVLGGAIQRHRERQQKGRAEKKRLLILGVICITLVIVSMWAWNMRIFWYRTQELTKEEPTIWDGSRKNLLDVLDQAKEEKDSLQQLVEVINQAGEKQDDKKALKDAVSSLLETTTTSTTSTIMNETASTTTSTLKNQ